MLLQGKSNQNLWIPSTKEQNIFVVRRETRTFAKQNEQITPYLSPFHFSFLTFHS